MGIPKIDQFESFARANPDRILMSVTKSDFMFEQNSSVTNQLSESNLAPQVLAGGPRHS